MSCFVVNDYHVNALVAWGVRHGAIVGISPDALAHMLACANRAAFHQRYAGDYPDESPSYEGFNRAVDFSHLAPVEIVKACDCLEYQACDWSEWRGSEPSAHLAVIRARALNLARSGVIAWGGTGGRADQDGPDLPGYSAAPWSLEEPDSAQASPSAELADQARALVAVLQGMAVHPSHYAALVAALNRVGVQA